MTGDKKGSMKVIMLIMVITLVIATLWNDLPWLKNAIHAVLDPTAGFLINWNLDLGMLIVVLIITLLTTLIQKYTTDQATLKELKKEQKKMQQELKKLDRNSKEYQELSMKSLASIGPMFKLSIRSFAYTGIPFILFFRWFSDYFSVTGNPLFLGFMSWFIFYLLASLVFSGILKKIFNVV